MAVGQAKGRQLACQQQVRGGVEMRVVSDVAGCSNASLGGSVSVTSPCPSVLSPWKARSPSPRILQQVPQPGATGVR